MSYDYSKLKGRIVEKFGTHGKFASEIGLSERSLSLKINSSVSWKQSEISRACAILAIPDEEIPAYFFATEV